MPYWIPPPPIPAIPIVGSNEDDDRHLFPIHRIYCVGKNYAAHVAEMGGNPSTDAPVFFTKPADAVLHCPSDDATKTTNMTFPLATENLHHEYVPL